MYETLLIRDERRIGRRTIHFGHYQITIVRLECEIGTGNFFLRPIRYAILEGTPTIDEMRHFVELGIFTGGSVKGYWPWINDRMMMVW